MTNHALITTCKQYTESHSKRLGYAKRLAWALDRLIKHKFNNKLVKRDYTNNPEINNSDVTFYMDLGALTDMGVLVRRGYGDYIISASFIRECEEIGINEPLDSIMYAIAKDKGVIDVMSSASAPLKTEQALPEAGEAVKKPSKTSKKKTSKRRSYNKVAHNTTKKSQQPRKKRKYNRRPLTFRKKLRNLGRALSALFK